MKKVRKNAVKKIREVLENNTWEFFNSKNDYKGGDFGAVDHVSMIVEDIQEGHAHMFQDGDNYVVRYAGRCKWVSQ